MANQQIIDEIKKAIGAHGTWKLKLRTAISLGRSDAEPTQVQCDNLCDFGKWLYGPTIDEVTRAGMPYQVVKRLHAEFHECAAKVLKLALDGQKDAAEALMVSEYNERSDKLIRALTKWRTELTRVAA
jgi:hypothetical protein